MELNELIDRVSYIRIRTNLSARKLSRLIGKTDGYIHHLEQSRKFAPTFETLMDILEVCNCAPAEFFYYSVAAYKQDREIIEFLKSTTAERKAIALEMLKVK